MVVGGGECWRWIVMGAAIQQATEACALAAANDLVLSAQAYERVTPLCVGDEVTKASHGPGALNSTSRSS